MSGLDRILSQLNSAQQEAVTYGEGPLLILAGAGSGKTRALTHRVAYLIKEKKVSPEKILLVTFTNRAAKEMKKRIGTLLASNYRFPFTGTFHSFCVFVLRRERKYLGGMDNFVIYDEKDQLATVKQAMLKLDFSVKKIKPSSVLATISQAKNELISAEEYSRYARGFFQEAVAKIFPAYQSLLREYQAFDFDDLLSETVSLFQKQRGILEKYQDRFQYVLVDEYQDTNHVQYRLTNLLAKKSRNLCVVGDCSQSIYSWRGADFRNILNLKKDFSDLKTISLEQNYRSTQTILKAANSVIVRNDSHPVLNLWTKNRKGKKITVFEAGSELEEAVFVAETIRFFLDEESFSLGDFGILYRTNAQSRVLEEVFLRSNLPYNLIGGIRFYERKEIKDCLAYLRLIWNPSDLISYQRVQKLGKRRLDRFYDFLESVKEKNFSTSELLDGILTATGYLDLYDKKSQDDLARLENIRELRSVAIEASSLAQFLENVALIQRESFSKGKIKTGRQKALNLMTIHAAKGAEFPVVFMVGMEEGLFPHSRSLSDRESLEEERRLCYVGMTRAKDRLFFSFARRRLYFGQKTSNPPSCFIGDISLELTERITA